jgi:phospholipase/carboxylesterase
MSIDNETISINNWVMRIQRPAGSGPFPVLIMLHGWSGDENSMWIFSQNLLKSALWIAPRGIYKTKLTGYSWHPEITKPWPWISDFMPAGEALINTISGNNFPDGDFSELHIIGFSQGAALAYTIACVNPNYVASLAVLSGFLPDGAAGMLNPDRLNGLPVFIAHGTDDDLVPIERARISVGLLQDAGADVIYCEDNVGHKLSTKCFRALEAFYNKEKC